MTFWDNTLFELFEKGGFAMWPLLFCSILGLAVVLERLLVFLLHSSDQASFLQTLGPLVLANQIDEARRELTRWHTPLARLAETFLAHRDEDAGARRAWSERTGAEQLASLELRVYWLAIIAQLAPMLGLLGTVTGLVNAFHQIEVMGGAVQASDLAAGIWEALITTVFGLVIAIPALAAYHAFDGRISRLAVEMEWLLSYLEQWSRPKLLVATPMETALPPTGKSEKR